MQRKFHSLVKDKANASADGSDNRGIRFMCGSRFSRKSVANKGPPGKHACKVKKKELFGDEAVKVPFSQLLALEDREDVKMKLPLLSFLYKKKGWKIFTRAGFSSNENGDKNDVIRFGQVRRKLSLRHLFRIPSKILLFRLKLKVTKFQVKKKATKQFEQEADDDENEDRELCKKRILMGGRCRPLSSPGYKEMYNSSWTRAQSHH